MNNEQLQCWLLAEPCLTFARALVELSRTFETATEEPTDYKVKQGVLHHYHSSVGYMVPSLLLPGLSKISLVH